MSDLLKHLREINPVRIWEGALARPVRGREVTVAVVELLPNAVVPLHQHPNEQLGMVLVGSMHFTLAGEQKLLSAGDTYNIPSNTPHQAAAGPDGAIVLDAFAPIRSDWANLPQLDVATPRWP